MLRKLKAELQDFAFQNPRLRGRGLKKAFTQDLLRRVQQEDIDDPEIIEVAYP